MIVNVRKIVIMTTCTCFMSWIFNQAEGNGCNPKPCNDTEEYRTTESYKGFCLNIFKWLSCTKYREVTKERKVCCDNYIQDEGCRDALCSGLKITNKNGACSIHYKNDSVTVRGEDLDTVLHRSGGTCIAPNICSCCNTGFYPDISTGYCKICPYIPMCEFRNCTGVDNNFCQFCMYENVPVKYQRAYRYDKDRNACIKTCSWRSKSTRCFPGTCSNEYATSCVCTKGFTSPAEHCTKITTEINITDAHVRFVDPDETVVSSPENVNSPKSVPKKWTNNIFLNKLNFSLGATYKEWEKIPAFGEHVSHFVTKFKYGIIDGKMKAVFIREKESTRTLFHRNCNSSCNEKSPCPPNDMYRCEIGKVNVAGLGFKHNDMLVVSVELLNGGFLEYEDRDNRKQPLKMKPVKLKGIKTTEYYEFHWDTILPYFDCSRSVCPSLHVYVPDTSKSNILSIHWNVWSDDLAGIHYYSIEVFELFHVGNGTDQGEIVERMKTIVHKSGITGLKSTINVTDPGMYAVHFTAFDRAGNHKSARALFLYDNNEVIDLSNGSIDVIKAKQYLGKGWITYKSPDVDVSWKDKFLKTDHLKHSWLAKVKKFEFVEPSYDDNSGIRTIQMVPNVRGIVKFESEHIVFGPDIKSSSHFTLVPDVYAEMSVQNVIWDDGDKVVVTIRAFDLLDNYRDENVTAYKDSTPPIISNLWLTKGDRVNIAVHSMEEFNEMVVEWDAFDYHSGISHLNWRLYDNFTGSDILHGEIDLPGQGETESLVECEEKYKDYNRGPVCYCTHYTGCYHKHFHIKPHLTIGNGTGNGIVHNRSMGVHDSDYFIDVNVTNMATLITIKTIKITIDITAPEPGHVHDGIYGFPEIDYQQDLQLDAYWEGFFDHESGVAFYQYEFASTCITSEDFKNKNMSDDTYDTFATFTAPAPGTYHVSVVAYNRAYDMSKVVCSDGVTITTDVPSVKNVIVMNAVTAPRLIKDYDGDEWYLDKNLNRHRLRNDTDTCKFSDPMPEDIKVFPIIPGLNGNVCTGSLSYTSLVTRILPKVHLLNVTWMSDVKQSLIGDYEVGLSSTSGSSAPDILSFQSSKHHTQILINHFGVPEGKLFFLIIKSISKSNVIGIQSIGPYIMDSTPPLFIGTYIDLNLSGAFLLANWSATSFTDVDDPYPLHYEYSIGHAPFSTDVRRYSTIVQNGPCTHSPKYMCTAIDISELNWKLHGNYIYHITIKATNLAGLSVTKTSEPYRHDILVPTKGIVIDVPVNSSFSAKAPLMDIEDIDYTDITDRLVVRWKNFRHPHQNVTYSACVGSTLNSCDVLIKRRIGQNINVYILSGLTLSYFKRYYISIFAESVSGSVSVSSDGVTVVDPKWKLPDLKIMDGHNCSVIQPLNASHHNEDTRPQCVAEIEFQISTSTLNAYFEIPQNYIQYMTHAFWNIEEKFLFGGKSNHL